MAKLNQQDVQTIRGIVNEAVKSGIDAHITTEVATVAQIVSETYQTMMEQEAREIFQVHGKMLETAAMIKEVAASGELDISMLGEEAEKRAYALAVTMAEQAVSYAESGLIETKRQISELQITLTKGGAVQLGDRWYSVSEREDWLKRLLRQEEKATERLNGERKRLADLKLNSRGLKLLVNDTTS